MLNWKFCIKIMKKINNTIFIFLKTTFFILIMISLTSSCSKSTFTSSSSTAPNDPLLKYAWHLFNTGQAVFAAAPATAGFDLNLTSTWGSQIFGSGIQIQVSDDGLEDTHEDLKANFPYLNKSKNYTLASPYTSTVSAPVHSEDNHGTAVAGLIAAAGWNDLGTRGVSPKAQLTIANFLSLSITQTTAKYLDQASGDFDISNMSWGTTQNTITPLDSTYEAQLKSMVTTKRNGKGAIFVKASGNNFAVLCNGSGATYCIGNSNFDGDNVTPYIIMVAALSSSGAPSSYSSVGPDLWISTFGGEFGDDTPAMLTTDRTGCSTGYAISSRSTAFERGANPENANCNYTTTFNGTSSAAPVLTGVIALLLEANPLLSWREIKHILAKTAIVDDYVIGDMAHPLSIALPSGYAWEQKWITNAAQFKYQNWFGFGRVNVDAAIDLAKSSITNPLSLGVFTETNWANPNSGLSTAIPDNSATGASSAISIATSLTVEAVQIKVSITHADISELALELTSPSGTKSILVNARNSLTGIANYANDIFLSNAFYQENSSGTWTLKVIDAKAGNTGTLTDFSLNIYGGAH